MKMQNSCYYVFEGSDIRHHREEIESTFYKVRITPPKGIKVYKIYEKCEGCETPVNYGYYILKRDWLLMYTR